MGSQPPSWRSPLARWAYQGVPPVFSVRISAPCLPGAACPGCDVGLISIGTIEQLGRVLINRQPNADLDGRPTSVIGGKADKARTCQYVR